MTVSNYSGLREVYKPPAPRATQKVLDHLDVHCSNFIALSPMCVLSSANASGQAGGSPRGDPPGFVQVLEARHCCCPTAQETTKSTRCRTSCRTPAWGCSSSCQG